MREPSCRPFRGAALLRRSPWGQGGCEAPGSEGASQSCSLEQRAGSEMPFCVLAGFMLIGSDVKLNSPSSLIGQALTEILQHPERARDALRVLLHLVSLSPAPTGPSALESSEPAAGAPEKSCGLSISPGDTSRQRGPTGGAGLLSGRHLCHGDGCGLFAKVLGPTLPLFLGHEALGKSPGSLSFSLLLWKQG